MCRLSGRHGTVFYCDGVACQHDPGPAGGGTRGPVAAACEARAPPGPADKCGCRAGREMNMWTPGARTLAPDSRHIVPFRSAGTTYRAADKSLAYIVVAVGVGGKASVPRP